MCGCSRDTHRLAVERGEGGIMATPLLQYVVRFDGDDEIVGLGWVGYKESRPWCSL